MRGGTDSPFSAKYHESESNKLEQEDSIAIKKPQLHPLDELEDILPDRIQRKYVLFKNDLFDMFPKDENNLAAIEMRQKEVSLYAKKNNLAPSLVSEWPVNLVFYLIIFERMSKEEILAIKNFEQLGWSSDVLKEARGISESLEFRREIFAYKGILEDILAQGSVIDGVSEETANAPKKEPKKSWVDELRKPSSEDGADFKERIDQWDESQQSVFQKQVQENNYSATEIDEMISGRDFEIENFDY